jgi:penicillin-binding protein 2
MIGSRGALPNIRSPWIDEGVFWIPGCDVDSCRFQNAGAEAYGPVDLPRSLKVSSDTYYYNLAYNFDVRRGFDQDSIQQAAMEFGYGMPTGITLPNERAGFMPTPESLKERFPDGNPWTTGMTINTSIGQGDVVATPIQIANSYATIANGGQHFAPGLADAALDPITCEVEQQYGPRLLNEIFFPPEFRDPIMEGLTGAVAESDGTEDAGTATLAFQAVGFPLDTWPVAGKTGTSEKTGPNGVPLADFAMFAGFGPIDDPRWAGTVILEEAGFGGNYAAPIFATVMNAIATDTVPRALTAAEIANGATAGDADGVCQPNSAEETS